MDWEIGMPADEIPQPGVILIVDDDQSLAELISGLVQDLGRRPLIASTGGQAVDLLSSIQVDLVILDDILPDMSALEFLGITPALPPFVITTGMGDERLAVQLMKAGARDYLVKDAHFLDILPQVIRRVLDQAQVERQLAQAQRDLADSEKRYRQLVELAQEGIWSIDAQARTDYVNPRMAQILGYDVEEMLGRYLFDFMDKTAQDEALRNLERRSQGISEQHEFVFTHKSGHPVITRLATAPIIDLQGRYLGAVAVITDITAQRCLEDELRFHSMLLDQISDQVTATDLQGVITYVNRAEVQTLKRSREELIGSRVHSYGEDPAQGATQQEIINCTLEQGAWRGEVVNFAADGARLFMDTRTRLLKNEQGQPVGMLGIGTDITQRKLAEQALRESEERFRQIFQASPDALTLSRLEDGLYIDVNDGFTRLSGYTREETVGKTSFEINIWSDPQDRQALASTLLRQGYLDNMEALFHRKNGTQMHGLLSARVIRLQGVEHLIAITRDISDRYQAEQALRESEERFRLIFQTSPDAISLTRPDGCIADVNDVFCRISGYSREELIGRSTLGLGFWAIPDDRQEVLRRLQDVGACENLETEFRSRGEALFPALISARPVLIQGVPHVLSVIRDISELKQAEEKRLELERRLLHAQKLESLGVLAGGIAHDFNNLLLAMLGNLELALEKLPASSPARDSVEQAVTAANHAADLTRQMLAYSGRGRFVVEPLDINQLVEENAHLFRAAVSRNTSLNVRLQGDLPLVQADAAQVQQVVMNLITNAADAIGEQPGMIRISTGAQVCSEADLARSRIAERPPAGNFVFIEVSDTGAGMDQSTLERLFEPFYTTKVAGRGLGMSAVQGILRGHQGAIFVDSAPGQGTRVRALFPAPQDAPLQLGTARSPASQPETGPEVDTFGLVLVVDDEKVVRKVCQDMLEHFGYSVLTAEDGWEAVEIFGLRHAEIDLVLLDLTMPRLNGLEAFHQMRLMNPDVPVVLSSGFDEQDALKQFAGEGLAGFIQKPYTMSSLREQVDQAIQPRHLP
jgi:PAS domain S-box-containing protein